VIKVPERAEREEYASITAASRELADEFGLRVVVDGSHNSIPPGLSATKRQIVMKVEPMSRATLESISAFHELITFLKLNGLADGVWSVLGGSPAAYIQLNTVYRKSMLSPPDAITAIKTFIFIELQDALTKTVADSTLNTKSIIEQFRAKGASRITKMDLNALGLSIDYPNKVFREVRQDKDVYVIPATPAVGLIIVKSIKNATGVESLCVDLFKP
jgi:hypothetical protein